MAFKWKKTWPTTCALKAMPFAAELEGITSRDVGIIWRPEVVEPAPAILANWSVRSPLVSRTRADRQNVCRGLRRRAFSPFCLRRRRAAHPQPQGMRRQEFQAAPPRTGRYLERVCRVRLLHQ